MIIVDFKANPQPECELSQYDYGRKLRIQGLNLPTAAEIQFSYNLKGGTSVRRIGTTKDGVTDVVIPESFLENNDARMDYDVYAFIYVTDATSGRTMHTIKLRVTARPKPEAFDKPSDEQLFKETMRVVNDAANRAGESAQQAKKDAENVSQMLNGVDGINKKVDDLTFKFDEHVLNHPSGGSGGSVSPQAIEQGVHDYFVKNPIVETDPTISAWAKEPTKPVYTAQEVGALPATTTIPTKTSELQNDSDFATNAKLTEHNTDALSHGDIRELVKALGTRLNAALDSTDVSLDQLSEIVAYIKSNKTLIEQVTTNKVNVADIVNNLTTNVPDKPLSASMGVELKKLVDALKENLNGFVAKDQGVQNANKVLEVGADGNVVPKDKPTIPTKLPNPHKLILQGAVTAEYDGSGAVTVTIPSGSSGGTAEVERIEKLATDTNVELEPNKLYIFPEMASLTYTLKAPTKNNVANEYHFVFKSGASATQLVHAVGVNIGTFKVEPNKIYEISIMENLLTSQSWAVV